MPVPRKPYFTPTLSSAVCRLLGYCPQTDPLLPLMTVNETLLFFGGLKGVGSGDDRDDSAASRRRGTRRNRYKHVSCAMHDSPFMVFPRDKCLMLSCCNYVEMLLCCGNPASFIWSPILTLSASLLLVVVLNINLSYRKGLYRGCCAVLCCVVLCDVILQYDMI